MGSLRKFLAAMAIPLVAAPAALAHTQDGSLGDAASATDYYQITCSDDGSGVPASMMAQVLNRGPAAATGVAVLIHRGISATSTLDPTGGDSTVSPLVSVNGADGVYNVFVTKAGTGAVNYTLTFHCTTGANGSGLHTGTTIVFRQNQ
jgi:hypothetical protein